MPGRAEIRIIPVSVCHQVSTMGQRALPITSWYHIQASGLIGSPTDPKSLKLERSWPSGCFSPHLMKARMAVGAVYRVFTRYFSIMLHQRSFSGQSGEPSYMRLVVPLARGP